MPSFSSLAYFIQNSSNLNGLLFVNELLCLHCAFYTWPNLVTENPGVIPNLTNKKLLSKHMCKRLHVQKDLVKYLVHDLSTLDRSDRGTVSEFAFQMVGRLEVISRAPSANISLGKLFDINDALGLLRSDPPSIAAMPVVDLSELDEDDIRMWLKGYKDTHSDEDSDSEDEEEVIKSPVENIDDTMDMTRENPDRLYRFDYDYHHYQCTLITRLNMFEFFFFDEKKSYNRLGTKGTSKFIKPRAYLVKIRNLQCWDMLLNCKFLRKFIRIWQQVTVSQHSPIYRSVSRAEDEGENPTLLKTNMERKVAVILTKEDFRPLAKIRKGEYEPTVTLWVQDYHGIKLTHYASSKKHRHMVRSKEFLTGLFDFLNAFFLAKDFLGVNDLKLDNLLYHEKKKRFSIIDFKSEGLTPAFLDQSSLMSPVSSHTPITITPFGLPRLGVPLVEGLPRVEGLAEPFPVQSPFDSSLSRFGSPREFDAREPRVSPPVTSSPGSRNPKIKQLADQVVHIYYYLIHNGQETKRFFDEYFAQPGALDPFKSQNARTFLYYLKKYSDHAATNPWKHILKK